MKSTNYKLQNPKKSTDAENFQITNTFVFLSIVTWRFVWHFGFLGFGNFTDTGTSSLQRI